MEQIYNKVTSTGTVIIDYCKGWEYIEIFGLTPNEFAKVVEEAGYQ